MNLSFNLEQSKNVFIWLTLSQMTKELSKMKAFADEKLYEAKLSLSLTEKKTIWEKKKMLVTSIFPLPTLFSKGFFF